MEVTVLIQSDVLSVKQVVSLLLLVCSKTYFVPFDLEPKQQKCTQSGVFCNVDDPGVCFPSGAAQILCLRRVLHLTVSPSLMESAHPLLGLMIFAQSSLLPALFLESFAGEAFNKPTFQLSSSPLRLGQHLD